MNQTRLFCPTGPSPCKLPKIFDLAVVVDSSGSIGEANFNKVKVFLSQLFEQFDISPTETRVGLVQYNQSPRYRGISPLKSSAQSKSYLKNVAQNLFYYGGKTRTDTALQFAYAMFFNPDGADRPQYPNVVIVMTDGKTNAGSKPYSTVLAPYAVRRHSC